jgi:hypothetical protein
MCSLVFFFPMQAVRFDQLYLFASFSDLIPVPRSGRMTSMSDFDAPKKPAWADALVPVLLELTSAGLYWFLSAKGEGGGGDPPVDGFG